MIPTSQLKLSDIMSSFVEGLPREETLATAVQLMAQKHISCLLILEEKHPVGILTERDMVRLLHNGVDDKTAVGEVMTSPVLTVSADLDFRAGYTLLRRKGVRHLVVTNDRDEVLGVTSETDFRNHLSQDVFRKIQNMRNTMDRDILSLPPDASLDHALERMIQERWDYVIVVEHHQPIGIVTERDIPQLLAQHADPTKICLRQIMTSPVKTVVVGASVTETLAQMTTQHIRHMVVVDAEGDIAGVISQHRVLELLGIEVMEDAWQTSEAHYREVVNTVREVIYQIDPQGCWRFLNPAWVDITGHPVDDWIGKPVEQALDVPDREAFRSVFAELMRGRLAEFKREFRFVHADGSRCWVEFFARATHDKNGDLIGATGTLFNITERKATEERLRQSAVAAEAANHAKGQFLANMSHELRTPLNGILGMAEVLLMTSLDDEQNDLAATLRQSAHALMGVINQILEFSNLEQGNVSVQMTRFSPAKLFQAIDDLYRPAAVQQGIKLTISGVAELPGALFADEGKLRQILINVVGNAIKFTHRGDVSVGVLLTVGGVLEVEVRDTGIGMSAAALRQLFAPFYQADGSLTRHGGTGLGLSVCKRLLDVLGGSIAVESVEGEGCCFTLRIPCSQHMPPALDVA